MRRSHMWLAAAGIAGVLAAAAFLASRVEQSREQERFSMLTEYCGNCHNDIDRSGGLTFDGLTPESVPEHAELFEAAITKLRGRLMPPPGNPQPAQAEVDELVAWLEGTIDAAAPEHAAGYVSAQRLSRTEFASVVEELLGVQIDPAEYLPTEIEIEGFSNIAAALSVSPAFLEQYVNVAGTVAHLAVGEPQPKVATAHFPAPSSNQAAYLDGMPLGTRGGIRFTHTFPADGEYRLTVTDLGVGLYPRALETRHSLVVLVDRTEVFRGQLGGPEDLELADRGGAPARAEIMERFAGIPFQVEAGVHEVIVTFDERSRASSDEQISTYGPMQSFSFSGGPRVPGIIGGIDMIGPFDSSGVSRTASREKLFVCEPEVPERERACAERITANLARRAFRRPVEQADIDRLMAFYEEGRTGRGGFDEGIELMVTAVLSSPDFLYRTIGPAPPSQNGESYALTDLELASRLSFFLWSQAPDAELLELAEAAELSDPAVLDSQVRRMLADPRAAALVTNFALGWLNVDDLEAVEPDRQLFPDFSEALRQDFAEEIALFLGSVLLEDKDVRTLLTADHTFLNERLARHYDVPAVIGPQFRRVALEDSARHGLLGKGAVLLRTSYGDRTSPVLRGAWVLDKLVGTPPTPPPPGVETNLSAAEGEAPRTLRERLEQHRANESCRSCHGVIDPFGLALENFSATGRWRERDVQADAPIDASTELPGGTFVDGPATLSAALLERPDQFVQALTEKLMMYALGRELEYHDKPQVRAIVRAAADEDFRFSALVRGVASSEAFRRQGAVVEGEGE